MNDRELLELAAKAAGLTLIPFEEVPLLDEEGQPYWNPLTDDGDALRLAVKLGMTVGQYNGNVFVGYGDDACEEVEPIGPDACAATRRAIARAAAEIGKGMGVGE